MSPSDPRVCLVCESGSPAAARAEVQTVALAEALAERGLPSLVVAVCGPRAREAEEAARASAGEPKPGIEVHRLRASSAGWRTVGTLLRKLDDLRARHDLLYVSGFRRLGVPVVAFARARGKRVLLHIGEPGEIAGVGTGSAGGPPAPGVPGRPRRALLLLADHFVATATALRGEIVAAGVPAARVSVIPAGVDLGRFRPAQAEGKGRLRERLGLPERAVVFCFSGRMVAWKAPLTLLEACRQGIAIRSRSEEALKGPQGLVLFLGSGGGHPRNQEVEARRFRNENGLEGRVRFLGDVLNVPDYLRAADAIVLPTLADAFSLALAEGMACGLAPVATNVCAEGNRLVHDENALVVPPGDVAALRDALIRLMDEPGLRERLGAAAARTARELSLEEVADRYAELIRRLAASSG